MSPPNFKKSKVEEKAMDEVRADLTRRLNEAGYVNLMDFWRNTGIQLSHETIRRALHGGKPPSVETLIKIGAHLGLSNIELAEMAKGLGDSFWPERLWHAKLSKRDEAVLTVINKLCAENPEYWSHLQFCWKIMAKAIGINIDNYLEKLTSSIEKSKKGL